MKRRRLADQVEHSRVIRPGGEAEWVSVVHRDGSISKVRIASDHDALAVGVWPAVGKLPHLTGYE